MDIGFAPILNGNARVLILGSMPSVESLRVQQYYAHPRNAFWFIMGELFGAGREIDYVERQQILKRRGIAVWDVIKQCKRQGSLDTAIQQKTLIVNDFKHLSQSYPRIEALFFNGKSVEALFMRHVLRQKLISQNRFKMMALPSTSPANARMRPEEKRAIWKHNLVKYAAVAH